LQDPTAFGLGPGGGKARHPLENVAWSHWLDDEFGFLRMVTQRAVADAAVKVARHTITPLTAAEQRAVIRLLRKLT
jgi:hypothetical protein